MFIETIHSVEGAWLSNLMNFCKRLMQEIDHSARVATTVESKINRLYTLTDEERMEAFQHVAEKAAALLAERLTPFFSLDEAPVRVVVTVSKVLETRRDAADVWMDVTLHPMSEVQAEVVRPAAKLMTQG